MKFWIILISFSTLIFGITLFVRIAKKSAKKIEIDNNTATIQNQISVFIDNNKENYRLQRRSAYIDLNDEKNWMFLKLASKFPNTTCQILRTFIDNHYELIRNS